MAGYDVDADPSIEDNVDGLAVLFANEKLCLAAAFETLVHFAVQEGLPTSLHYLLKSQPEPGKRGVFRVSGRRLSTVAVLHFAVINSTAGCVEVLVGHGAEMNEATSRFKFMKELMTELRPGQRPLILILVLEFVVITRFLCSTPIPMNLFT